MAITADDSAFAPDASVHIPGGSKRVTFSFIGLSLSSPTQVRFRFQLDGYDHGWTQPSEARQAGYTNLSPGPYRFRVIASNPDGVWSSTEAAIQFHVDPLYWQTPWFRLIVVLTCALTIAALYRMRLHQLTRQLNVRFNERLAERSRIARELHDTLLQSFQGLTFRFQAARNMLPGRPEDAMEALDAALDRSEEAMAEGRDAIHGLRSSTIVTNELAQAVKALGDEMASEPSAHGSTTFHLVLEGPPRDLHPILRDEIYAIVREAVRNAFRHAQARNIEVDITYSGSLLRLRIRDDGKGIDPGIATEGREGHYGVPGMRERAKRIGAQLNFWTGNRAGTEIELSIPAAIAYGTSPKRTILGLFRRKAARNHD
jgi:signal transduction histidine kinase